MIMNDQHQLEDHVVYFVMKYISKPQTNKKMKISHYANIKYMMIWETYVKNITISQKKNNLDIWSWFEKYKFIWYE